MNADEPIINIATGSDITIREFAACVAEVVGYQGEIVFDPARPDRAPRKLLDVSRLATLGWQARTSLRDGLAQAYRDFIANGARHPAA